MGLGECGEGLVRVSRVVRIWFWIDVYKYHNVFELFLSQTDLAPYALDVSTYKKVDILVSLFL